MLGGIGNRRHRFLRFHHPDVLGVGLMNVYLNWIGVTPMLVPPAETGTKCSIFTREMPTNRVTKSGLMLMYLVTAHAPIDDPARQPMRLCELFHKTCLKIVTRWVDWRTYKGYYFTARGGYAALRG